MNQTIDIERFNQRKQKQQICIGNNYHIMKMLFKGDYLAKDANDHRYLLSNTLQKRRQYQEYDLNESHIVEPIQIIQDHSHLYEVFPLEKKMIWAGDLLTKNKSEIYCVTLLYNAIRNIIRPLKTSVYIKNVEKYIIIENIFVRETSVFLFLRNKEVDKNIYKTQFASQRKKINHFANTQSKNKNEMGIIKKVGEVFWSIFFSNEKERSTQSKGIFKNILLSMIQEKITLQELEKVMEDRSAKKKFQHNNNEINPKYYTKHRYGTIDINDQGPRRNKQLIDSVSYKFQDINFSKGKGSNGFLVNHYTRNRGDRLSHHNNVLSFDQNVVPPSFSKGKRFKRLSLFKDAKSYSIDVKSSNKYTLQHKTQAKNNRYSINVDTITDNFSFSTQKKHINQLKSSLYQANSKKSRNIKAIFNDIMANQDTKLSNIDKFHKKSQEKAIILLKKSIEQTELGDSSKISDEKFKNALKQKRQSFKRNIKESFSKVHEFYSQNKQQSIKPSIREQIKKKESIKIANNIHDYSLQNKAIQQKALLKNDQFFSNQNNQANQREGRSQLQQLVYLSSLPAKKTIIHQPKQQARSKQHILQKQQERNEKKWNLMKRPERNNIKQPTQQPINRKQQGLKPTQLYKITQQNLKSYIKEDDKRQTQQKQQKQMIKYESKVELMSIIMDKTSKVPTNMQQKQKYYSRIEENVFNSMKEPEYQVIERNFPLNSNRSLNPINNESNSSVNEQISEKQQTSLQKKPKQAQVKTQKSVKTMKNIPVQQEDQIQQINIGVKKQIETKKQKSLSQIPKAGPNKINNQQASKKLQNKKEIQSMKSIKSEQISKKPEQIIKKPDQIKEEPLNGRVKTSQSNQSNASSTGIKSIKKQIDEYIYMINRMGEAVAKTSKLSKKLQKIQWYTGLYFLYKRFFYERKNIQKCLEESLPQLTRKTEVNLEEWKQWFEKGQRQAILAKCKDDNKNIESSLKKMAKKIQAKQLPGRVSLCVPYNKNMKQSTKIAVEHIVDEYDQAVQEGLDNDPEIFIHLCEMINSLYVLAQLDGKISDKKPINEISNIKRTKEQLNKMVELIYDKYQQ